MIKRVIFPGSFDPITHGHLDLIHRARTLFGEVIVGVAKDTTGRNPFFSFEERTQLVQTCLQGVPGVIVKPFSGLLIDFYKEESAQAIVRGLRNGKDFEYEFQLAQVNHQLLNDMETVFIVAAPQHLFISASLVREIASLGGDVRPFIPDAVVQAYAKK
jgi:pantetheine-phosphate adenylyltransferase